MFGLDWISGLEFLTGLMISTPTSVILWKMTFRFVCIQSSLNQCFYVQTNSSHLLKPSHHDHPFYLLPLHSLHCLLLFQSCLSQAERAFLQLCSVGGAKVRNLLSIQKISCVRELFGCLPGVDLLTFP